MPTGAINASRKPVWTESGETDHAVDLLGRARAECVAWSYSISYIPSSRFLMQVSDGSEAQAAG